MSIERVAELEKVLLFLRQRFESAMDDYDKQAIDAVLSTDHQVAAQGGAIEAALSMSKEKSQQIAKRGRDAIVAAYAEEAAQPAPVAVPVDRLIEGLDEITDLSRHLRQGGCDSADLAGLEEGLTHAIEMAAEMLSMLAAAPQPPVQQAWKCSSCGATTGEGCNANGCFSNESEPAPAQDEREAFEAAYLDGPFGRTPCGTCYLSAPVEQAWRGWRLRGAVKDSLTVQSTRPAQIAPPQPVAYADPMDLNRMEKHGQACMTVWRDKRDCVSEPLFLRGAPQPPVQQAEPTLFGMKVVRDDTLQPNELKLVYPKQTEPAPAQDEREAALIRSLREESRLAPRKLAVLLAEAAGAIESRATLPAQTEQQPWTDAMVTDFLSVALRHVEVKGTLHAQDIRDALRYMTERYTAPIAQTEPQPAARQEQGEVQKYDDVLLPFLAMMRAELHANAGKGDRPGWLAMDRKTALLEIFYHLGKLQKATKNEDKAGIREYSADVANMSMMLADICGCLGVEQ